MDVKATDASYEKPPLFGLPVSIKECIAVKGYDQTRGYAQDIGHLAEEDALIVQQLKELGAIPFVLTNVPQTIVTVSCNNPIYGETTHPLDNHRSSGGSSGGEAALIACGGYIVGIGGDVAASIRVPAHCCGISGIKPSHLRISRRGATPGIPGYPLVNDCDGPMAADAATCAKMLRHLFSNQWMHRHDPYVPPVDWNEEEFRSDRPLRIGYYADDNWFRPTPPLQRAVYEAKDRLEKRGHELVPFIPPDAPRALQLFVGALFLDGGDYIYRKLKSDLLAENFGLAMTALSLPIALRRLSAAALDFFYPRMAHFLRSFPRNTLELRQIYAEILEYRTEFAKHMQEQHLDALLCPVQASFEHGVCPAMRNDEPVLLEASVSYTALFNLLDYAAGTTRITEVAETDLQLMATSYPESDPWYRLAKESTKGTLGFPVGVQVAAPPYCEEVCMRILCELEGSA